MREDYIYAVARIRCRETSLLTNQDVETLAAAKSFDECIKLLTDRGWGNGTAVSPEKLLSEEEDKIWELIKELTPDLEPFSILFLPVEFNNLKAAIKSTLTSVEPENVYVQGVGVPVETIKKAVRENDFSILPENLRAAAQEAYITLLHTGDGQLCDAILDRACLNEIMVCGRESKNELLLDYAELTVAISDIKIAVRSCKTRKTLAFISSALAPCGSLDINSLATAAKELENVFGYLSSTPYSEAVEHLKASYSSFEKWCDDKIMALIKEQKSNPFTIGPLFAYVLARRTEISVVRIILSGKLNEIDDSVIRERLRDMYV